MTVKISCLCHSCFYVFMLFILAVNMSFNVYKLGQNMFFE